MVGLRVVLEGQKSSSVSASSSSSSSSKKVIVTSSQVVNKTNMIINNKPSSFSSFHNQASYFGTTFLDQCFLCNQKLSPRKDIYMYKGDRAFCSVECRCRQIFMDEEESKSIQKNNCCSLAAIKPTNSSSSSSSRHRKGTKN